MSCMGWIMESLADIPLVQPGTDEPRESCRSRIAICGHLTVSNVYVTFEWPAIRLLEYIDSGGLSPWAQWHGNLDAEARAKVPVALYRMAEGNFSNVKGVGGGVFERVLDWGPGYRIYFGKDGDAVVILLGGSSKKDQQRAIDEAKRHWDAYRQRKTGRKPWH